MTRYVINPFQAVELPTFNPDWRQLCDRCVHRTLAGPGKAKTPKVTRCGAAATNEAGGPRPACSEVRHTACANGEMFRERIA